ncbi:Anti-repressor SinI [Salinibacillus kushneri]|uniref:Anti-repressor SinI n=1 Tax=Salinibacillus kushneri TaxID=237682 RepID=A0A1H9ZG83_9BACI|nr:Anti-repressor SinI [Salinibacillus kushneri]
MVEPREELDPEWVSMILEALQLGILIIDIQTFLREKANK